MYIGHTARENDWRCWAAFLNMLVSYMAHCISVHYHFLFFFEIKNVYKKEKTKINLLLPPCAEAPRIKKHRQKKNKKHPTTEVEWCHLATLGQLNTSHYRLASLKRLINPSDQPPVTIRQTSRRIGQSLHGQHGSTPTQVRGNWNAGEKRSLPEHLMFIHTHSLGQTDSMGFKIKAKVTPSVVLWSENGSSLF